MGQCNPYLDGSMCFVATLILCLEKGEIPQLNEQFDSREFRHKKVEKLKVLVSIY